MRKHFLIIATLLLGLTATFTACTGASQEGDKTEQTEETSKPQGEDYDLAQLEKGSLYLKADTVKGSIKAHYVRFNPSMILFFYGDLNLGTEKAAQYYVMHDAASHTVKVDHCVFTHHAEAEFVNQFLNKTITIEKNGDNLTITGINEEFDGTYTFRGDDDHPSDDPV